MKKYNWIEEYMVNLFLDLESHRGVDGIADAIMILQTILRGIRWDRREPTPKTPGLVDKLI